MEAAVAAEHLSRPPRMRSRIWGTPMIEVPDDPTGARPVMSVLDRDRGIRRVGLVSMHTSPFAQPGDGDAGGLNTYVIQTAGQLAVRGIEVEILTRATRSD